MRNNNQLLDLLNTSKNLMDSGQHVEALKVLESALECSPEPWLKIEIYFQAAICDCEIGDYAGAVQNLEMALYIAGDVEYADKKHIYDILRIAYTHKPDYEKLETLCRMLIDHEEDKNVIVLSLIYAYSGLKKWTELARIFNDYPDTDFGNETLLLKIYCFTITGRHKEAILSAGKYIERFGEDYKIYTNLMRIYYSTGDGEKGFDCYKKATVLCDRPEYLLNVVGALLVEDLYRGVISDEKFPDIIKDMSRSTEKLQTNTVFQNTTKPFRKIKIGYLTADFKEHPVGFFLLPVMKNTVACQCFNYCFNLAQRNDEINPVTTQFKSLADVWEEVYERSDSYIEQLFLTNRIDIAFDVMCYTDNNRMQLYARRLAPLQISWIGLPVTTGVAAMDYVITDRNVDPPGSEKYYTEKLLYLPESFLCTTIAGSPQSAPPAFTRNGYISFACFHNFKKITNKILNMWREILERLDNSRIKIMGHMPAGDADCEMLNERIIKMGLPAERVSILPKCELNNYFAAYNDVDIMLDTYPFSGATTTFDALRMGRPIITLVGERHVSRVSYSLLKHVGLEDLAAYSEDEYVEKAVALANDHERLYKINADLPRLVMDSPLTNQSKFRENFEKIIRDVWVGFCLENRAGCYDYGSDSPWELLEQVVNATVYIERKLDSCEAVDDTLRAEYLRAQIAFFEKLNLLTKNEEFVNEYGKMVEMIGRSHDDNNLSHAISMAKQNLNVLYNRELHVAAPGNA